MSNLTDRRNKHIDRVRVLQRRKRLRNQRAEISAALVEAKSIFEAQLPADPHAKATDKKKPNGWPVVNSSGTPIVFCSSRDLARAAAKEMRERDGKTKDEIMLELGFRRIGEAGTVEQRWEKVA